jgi:hypothetical protein
MYTTQSLPRRLNNEKKRDDDVGGFLLETKEDSKR